MTESNQLPATGYQFGADLVQAVVAALNTQPASAVRGLLNALERACVEQDQARAAQAAAAMQAEIRAEVRAELGSTAAAAAGP